MGRTGLFAAPSNKKREGLNTMGNTSEALQKWQMIGERIKRVRQSVGMTTALFAYELGTSTLNIDIIENLSRCDKTLLQKPQTFAKEMRWETLINRISHRFTVSEEWLFTGEGRGSVTEIEKNDAKGRDDELVVSVPLMISGSLLVEGANMIVTASKGVWSENSRSKMTNALLYSTLTDLFLVYYQEMSVSGRSDIAEQTTVTMLNAMKHYSI